MMTPEPMRLGFFASYRKHILTGLGIGAGCAVLICAALIFSGGAKVTAVKLADQAILGRDTEADVTVENTGLLPAKYDARLTVDGSNAASQQITLMPGESRVLKLTLRNLELGGHNMEAGGVKADIRVLKPASFTVTSMAVAQKDIRPGDDVTVTAKVDNTGEVKGEFKENLLLDGQEVTPVDVSVDAGGEQVETFTLRAVARGKHIVSLSGVAQPFSSLAPASIAPSDIELSAEAVQPNGKVQVTATVSNDGDLPGSYTVQLLVNGAPAGTQQVNVDGNQTAVCSFEVAEAKEGVYTIAAGSCQKTLCVAVFSRPTTNTMFVKSASGGYCTLRITNKYAQDAIVTLAAKSAPGKAVLSFYIRAGEKSKTFKVKNGEYYVFYTLGQNFSKTYRNFMMSPIYQAAGSISCTTYTTTRYVDYGWWSYPVKTIHYYAYDFPIDVGDKSYSIDYSDYPK